MRATNDKTRETRIRRMAAKKGWRLEKSRARQLHSNNQGKYQLIDDRNTVREGVNYDAGLDRIEHYLETHN
jgi:hypothetical protein